MTTTPAPRHRRHRALAELDRLIGLAEEAMARRLAEGGQGPGMDPADAARAEVLLYIAEEKLAELRLSRAALLADEAC